MVPNHNSGGEFSPSQGTTSCRTPRKPAHGLMQKITVMVNSFASIFNSHGCLEAPIFFEAWWAIGLEDNTQENSRCEPKKRVLEFGRWFSFSNSLIFRFGGSLYVGFRFQNGRVGVTYVVGKGQDIKMGKSWCWTCRSNNLENWRLFYLQRVGRLFVIHSFEMG